LLRAPTGAPIRRLSAKALSSDGFRRFAPKLQNGFIAAALFLRGAAAERPFVRYFNVITPRGETREALFR
jgi:hypothetical protein